MILSSKVFVVGCTLFVVSSAALAQFATPLGQGPAEANARASGSQIFVSGKVLVDDGSVVPSDVTIQTVCEDRVRSEAYVDLHGEFQFQVSGPASAGETLSGMAAAGTTGDPENNWSNCELRASVAGYTSSRFSFAGKVAGTSQINVGTLLLHPVKEADNLGRQVVSAEALAVPDKAKKYFGKGEDYLRKSEWKQAQDSFRKALDRSPSFSEAWAELARSQRELGDITAAQESFHRALELNPRLLAAYAGLSDIALQARQWKNLEDSTDRFLAINADSFPQFWLLNAVAKYNLGLFGPAETSVLRGLRLDPQHHYPKMEHLFGMILAIKHQYAQAADHLQNYLRLDPKAPDATAVQVQLYKIEQLAASRGMGK